MPAKFTFVVTYIVRSTAVSGAWEQREIRDQRVRFFHADTGHVCVGTSARHITSHKKRVGRVVVEERIVYNGTFFVIDVHPVRLLVATTTAAAAAAANGFVQSMAGVLNLIASIWESILPDLAKNVNEPSLELIQQTVTGESQRKREYSPGVPSLPSSLLPSSRPVTAVHPPLTQR